jgi:hypothetical protein
MWVSFPPAFALLTYLEGRELSEREACAVMGVAITSLIRDPATAREFCRVLQQEIKTGAAMATWVH